MTASENAASFEDLPPESVPSVSVDGETSPTTAELGVELKDKSSPDNTPGLLSLIYTHNPFYLISACLFVYGLKKLFRVGNSAILFDHGSVAYMEPWGFMLSLAAVTALMTVTAILIVRLGQVWEDARSIVLIVLLMLLANSVSIDELLTVRSDRDNPHSLASLLILIAFSAGFASGLTELLIRGLQIRLSVAWRLPLHAFLVTFFAYPLLLLPEFMPLTTMQIRWLIAAFPLVASAITLALIPAVRRGAASVAGNGTPWMWPWFPWTPFVLMAGAVCFRTWSLTISFDAPLLTGHFWDSAFGVYLLVPFLLSMIVVVLEIGLVENNAMLRRLALLSGPLLIVLAHPMLVPWNQLPSYMMFTQQLTSDLASPVYLTTVALAIFYAATWIRGIRSAEVGFVAMMVILAFLQPRAMASHALTLKWSSLQTGPLAILAIVELTSGLIYRRAPAVLAGAAATLVLFNALLENSTAAPWSFPLTLHVFLLITLLIVGTMNGEFGRFLRIFGAFQLPATLLICLVWMSRQSIAQGWMLVYACVLTAAVFVLARVLRDRLYLIIALGQCVAAAILSSVWTSYQVAVTSMPDGVKPVLLAGLSFVAALFISVLKSGLADRLRTTRVR